MVKQIIILILILLAFWLAVYGEKMTVLPDSSPLGCVLADTCG